MSRAFLLSNKDYLPGVRYGSVVSGLGEARSNIVISEPDKKGRQYRQNCHAYDKVPDNVKALEDLVETVQVQATYYVSCNLQDPSGQGRILTIKALRQATGFGLKEAVDHLDLLQAMGFGEVRIWTHERVEV